MEVSVWKLKERATHSAKFLPCSLSGSEFFECLYVHYLKMVHEENRVDIVYTLINESSQPQQG